MALADMYKTNNVTYYESGQGMSGVFTDTIENLTADGMIDYSIFLNTGSTWSMKNTGAIGNHFAWYADWVAGVLAVRQGPDVMPITYLGSAILSKNTGCTVASLSAKQADGSGWADFKNARFMIDAIQFTQGSASQYVPFDYGAYTGTKYGFNSCFIESTAGYATSNTAYNYTSISDYTTLTGDNAKRIVYSKYQVMLTGYNPYLADSVDIGKYNVGYIWDFFDIDGEIVCVRDILRMPNSAHWQSWSYYHDETDKYVTIGGFGNNIVAGTQGALPQSDDVKGIFSYNHNGTSANWFTTKNAVDYKTNSMGLRWCVGNTTISTAKQWRDNVRLGVMNSAGVITHNQWIVGEAAIQASDNPNKNTDYDHIPGRGPGPGPDTDDPWHGVSYGSGGYGVSPFCTSYAMTAAELTQLAAWGGKTEEQGGPKPGYDYMPSIISLVELPMEVSGTAPSTVKFSRGTLGGYESNIVDTGVSGNPITAGTQRYNLGSVTLPLRMEARGYPFLDWDTVVELYMPFVGMFSLDPFAVLGKTITAFMDLDVLNGTICGYAYVTNNGEKLPVAYGSAQVGVSLPVTSDGAATARLALTTANSQLGSSMASSVLQLGGLAALGGTSAVKGSNAWTSMQSARGAGLAAPAGRSIFAGGAADAVGGYVTGTAQGSVVNSFINWGLSLKQLQSSNNTQVNGSMGGGSFSGWSTPNAAYVKIIRPHAAPGAKASEYGKTHAYPYEDNATLVDCEGLTFAVNPNVTGITKATDAERSQIAEILMGGVIA